MAERDTILSCSTFPDEFLFIIESINAVDNGVIFGSGCDANVFNTTLASICSTNAAVRQAILTAICTRSAVSFPNNYIGLKRADLESKLTEYLLEAPGITPAQRELCDLLASGKRSSPKKNLNKRKTDNDNSLNSSDTDINAYLNDPYGDDFESLVLTPEAKKPAKSTQEMSPTIEEYSDDDSLDAKMTELLVTKGKSTGEGKGTPAGKRLSSATKRSERVEHIENIAEHSSDKKSKSFVEDDLLDQKMNALFGFKSASPKLEEKPDSPGAYVPATTKKESTDDHDLYGESDEDFEEDPEPYGKPSSVSMTGKAAVGSTEADHSNGAVQRVLGAVSVAVDQHNSSTPLGDSYDMPNTQSPVPESSGPVRVTREYNTNSFQANQRPKSAAPRFARATVVSTNLFKAIETDAMERKKEALRRPSSARWCSQLSDPIRDTIASNRPSSSPDALHHKPHGFPSATMLKRVNSAHNPQTQAALNTAAGALEASQTKRKCTFFTKDMMMLCYKNMLHALKRHVNLACQSINKSVADWHNKLEKALVRAIDDLETKQINQRRLLFKTTKVSKAHKSLHDFLLSSRHTHHSPTASPTRQAASHVDPDLTHESPEDRHPRVSYSEAGEVYFSSPSKHAFSGEEEDPDNEDFLHVEDTIAFEGREDDDVYKGLAETQRQFSSGPLPSVIERMRLRHAAEMEYVADSIKEPLERLHTIFKKKKQDLHSSLFSTNEMLAHLKRLRQMQSDKKLNITVKVREQRGMLHCSRMMQSAVSHLVTHYSALAELFHSGGFAATTEKFKRFKKMCLKVNSVVESIVSDKNLEKAANVCNVMGWGEEATKEQRAKLRKHRSKIAKKAKGNSNTSVEYAPSDAASKATTPHTTATRPLSAPIGLTKTTSTERIAYEPHERTFEAPPTHKRFSAPPLRGRTMALTSSIADVSSTDEYATDTGDEYTSDDFESLDVSRTHAAAVKSSDLFSHSAGMIESSSEPHFLEDTPNMKDVPTATQDCATLWTDLQHCNDSLVTGDHKKQGKKAVQGGLIAEDDILEMSADDDNDKTLMQASPFKMLNNKDREKDRCSYDSASDFVESDEGDSESEAENDLFPSEFPNRSNKVSLAPLPGGFARSKKSKKMNWKDSEWNVGMVSKEQMTEHMKAKSKKIRPKSSKSTVSVTKEKEQVLKSDRQRPRSAFQQRNGDVDLLLQSLPTCLQEPSKGSLDVSMSSATHAVNPASTLSPTGSPSKGKSKKMPVEKREMAQWNMHPCTHCHKSYRGTGKIIPTACALDREVVQSFHSTQTVLQPAKKLSKKEMKLLESQKRVGNNFKMHNYNTRGQSRGLEETGFRARAGDGAFGTNSKSSLRSSEKPTTAATTPIVREFCSWKCVKAFSQHHCTVQKRYEIETLVDLAAGYLV